MAADGRIVIDVILDDGSVVQGLANIDGQFSDLDRNGSSRLAKIGGGIKNLAKVAAVGATAVVGIGAAIGGLAAPLVKAAGDAQAMNAQFEQVFGTLEASATDALNKIADETGIIPERLKGSFTQIAAFAKTTGMDTANSLALTERATLAAADSAAFYDKSIEDVTESLQSFLKGNFENDAALGISATETTRNAKANELYGQSFKDLDEAQKQLTLLAMVEDGNKLSGAMGQAARETDGLENVMGNLKQAWENLKVLLGAPLLEPAVAGIKLLTEALRNFDATPFLSAFEMIKQVIQTVIDFIVPFVQERLEALRQFWDSNGQAITTAVTTAFETVKQFITDALNVIVPFIQEQLAKIQQFWSENGEQIMEAVKNTFDAIKAVIDFVMPAIQFVIEYVWNAIKNVISGALDVIMGLVKTFSSLLTGDFKGMWEGVKQLFKGAIDLIIGLMSLSFVGSIRTLVTNFAKTFVNLIKTKWNTVVGLFKNSTSTVTNTISSWVGKILEFIRNLATNFTGTITRLRSDIVARFNELSSQIINTTQALPSKFLQIGKDIISGLINGIKSMASSAIGAITGVVDGVVNKAKSLLQINSPSKLFAQFGEWTGEGLSIGITKTEKLNTDAVKGVGDSIIEAAKSSGIGVLSPKLDVANPLRGVKLNLGLDKPAASTSNISNIYNYSKKQAEPPQMVVQSAPIILNGQKIADVIFEAVSVNQRNNMAIKSMVKGV